MRILPMWIGIALVIFLMQIAVCGIVHDDENVRTLLKFLDMMPGLFKSALGGEGLQVGNTASLIAIGYNHPLVLTLYMLFAVAVPTSLLAGEVQRGTMELVLSRHITKLQVYACAGVLALVGMFALVIVMFLGTVVGTTINDFGEPIPLYRFFQTAINGGLLASTAGAISLLCAASFPRRGMAVGVAVGYLVVNYFITVTSQWWSLIKSLRPITLFHYTNGYKIFVDHVWPVSDMCVLATILAASAVSGAIIWQRRDLPL
jgi:ABC-2 type transport system permease protein